MINQQWAQAFALDWIESWNTNDMDRILAHYTDDFEMSSPLIVERLGLPGGTLKGKDAIRDYWAPSVTMEPPLQFALIDVFVGVGAVTIYYNSVGRRMVAETLFIDSTGKATRGMALWSVTQT
jgi:ketosteroid isomerase-like protein